VLVVLIDGIDFRPERLLLLTNPHKAQNMSSVVPAMEVALVKLK
jgi:hypothetical protein